FVWSSWISVALFGSWMGLKRTGLSRTFGWMSLSAFASCLAFNSGYYMWWGGWSMGARLMLPIMAALPLALRGAFRPASRLLWRVLVVTGIVSIAMNVPLSIMDPQLRQGYDDTELLASTLTTRLWPPQFHFLKVYFSGEWFIGPGGVVHAGHFV